MNKTQWLVFKSYKTLCSKPNSLLWTYEGLATHHSNTHCFAHCPVVSAPPDHPHSQRPCIKATVEWGNWWGFKHSLTTAGITFYWLVLCPIGSITKGQLTALFLRGKQNAVLNSSAVACAYPTSFETHWRCLWCLCSPQAICYNTSSISQHSANGIGPAPLLR